MTTQTRRAPTPPSGRRPGSVTIPISYIDQATPEQLSRIEAVKADIESWKSRRAQNNRYASKSREDLAKLAEKRRAELAAIEAALNSK